jgi:16S rRNA (guanine527-N7)-methyltransferase
MRRMNEAPPSIAGRVERAAAALGIPAGSEGAARSIGTWVALVAAWNAKIDLTAARSDDELVDLMVADALWLAARVPASAKVVDVGSGAGAPGLPLAIARPDLRVTLVEPLQKRVSFLRTAVGSLYASGAGPVVVRAKGEAVVERGDRFDVAISRATLAPAPWLDLGAALAPEGEVWVLLAQGDPPARDGWAIADDLRYRWPLTGADRRAVRYRPAR